MDASAGLLQASPGGGRRSRPKKSVNEQLLCESNKDGSSEGSTETWGRFRLQPRVTWDDTCSDVPP